MTKVEIVFEGLENPNGTFPRAVLSFRIIKDGKSDGVGKRVLNPFDAITFPLDEEEVNGKAKTREGVYDGLLREASKIFEQHGIMVDGVDFKWTDYSMPNAGCHSLRGIHVRSSKSK